MNALVGIGCDHAGFSMKARVIEHLRTRGVEVRDFGCDDATPVDYPRYAMAVARAVAAGDIARGIAMCGSGVGVSIAANRIRGARAANATDETLVRLARGHTDINVLCVGAELVGFWKARACIDAFLDTPFDGGRHVHRVQLLDQ